MSANSPAFEVNCDGLVGPTHNYAGLSHGNVASSEHGGLVSSPRQAALQGLEKMMSLARLGLRQAVLPPQERPHVPTLRRLGFHDRDPARLLARVQREAPQILAQVSSASSMWVANAATVSPAADCADGRVHFTPANLASMFHRSLEVATTGRVLAALFRGPDYCHHEPLPAGALFADEGAANHTRFCLDYGGPGVELFVYGSGTASSASGPARYPARQTLKASQAIARSHGLPPESAVFLQQNPAAIDAGVFHNDVIAVGNRDLLFYHELAFADAVAARRQLDAAAAAVLGLDSLHYIEVPASTVSLDEAVASYLFNSQLVNLPGAAGMTLIVPQECREIASVDRYLAQLLAEQSLIGDVRFFDLRQSMNNGGGPACLRLRVVLNDSQIDALAARVMLDEALYQELRTWIETHYRDRLTPEDLADPQLLEEGRRALDELSRILRLGKIYEFQQA